MNLAQMKLEATVRGHVVDIRRYVVFIAQLRSVTHVFNLKNFVFVSRKHLKNIASTKKSIQTTILITLLYKVTSERCSTFKLLRKDRNTKRSFALKRKSISKPVKWTLTMSKSESQTRMFKSPSRAEWENLTEPGGTGVSGIFERVIFFIAAATLRKHPKSFWETCFCILRKTKAIFSNV